MRRRHWRALAAALALLLPAGRRGGAQVVEQRNPMDSIRALPGYRAPRETGPLISARGLAALPRADRARWAAYLERSSRRRALDTAAMNAELRAIGATRMTRAPYGKGFAVTPAMTAAWFAGDSARLVGERLLGFQAPNGGWSKHVDVLPHARRPGESYFGESEEWTWISTVDNGSTVSQLQFLAALDAAQSDPRWRAGYLRGIDYLLDAQFPNGCWPQVWPLQGGYHDAITFNDDATVNVATLLREVGEGKVAFVPDPVRARAAAAARATVGCLVATQVLQRGALTIWGQQHHPLTLEPVAARSYEHASLSSQESAAILRYLMGVRDPSPAVVRAVHAGAAWLQAHALHDIAYTFDGGLRSAPGAGPVWARMYELDTDRPLFSNRDGIRRYDWNELTDRRQGYGWYSYAPVAALEDYDRWRVQHPRPIPRAKERTQTP